MNNDSETVAPARSTFKNDALVCHLLPFVAWLVLMALPDEASALKYALRTLVTGALLLYLRPWRWYLRPRAAHILPAIGVGLGVFLVWIAGESALAKGFPALQDAYLRFGILPFAQRPLVTDSVCPYDPAVCGWALSSIRILGSAVVIALAEEFFWRGCLYRMLIDQEFTKVDLGRFHAIAFWVVCAAFGFEHQRWFVGVLAGLAYALLMLKTRSIWPPIIAHGITNLLLGLYVVQGEHYSFWV